MIMSGISNFICISIMLLLVLRAWNRVILRDVYTSLNELLRNRCIIKPLSISTGGIISEGIQIR